MAKGRKTSRAEQEEVSIDTALSILKRDYYKDVRSVAQGMIDEVKSGEIEDREAFHDRLHEDIDGTQRVIYTRQAMLGVISSDNDGAMWDEGLDEGVDFSGGIPWSQIMYAAMMRDVIEDLGVLGFDPDDDDSYGDDEDDDEDEEDDDE